MKNIDVLVIGGGPAGIISSSTAKAVNPEKSVGMVREEPNFMIPCAIPYTFGTLLPDTEKDMISSDVLRGAGVDVIVDKIEKVDLEEKIAYRKNESIKFEKLVFATGSLPNIPKIGGVDAEGVFEIEKYKREVDKFNSYLNGVESKNVVIVGSGFIGVEVAGELVQTGRNVYLVGSSNRVLKPAFDAPFSEKIEEELHKLNVNIMNSTRVEEIITEDGKVKGVKLNSGETIETETVILSIGYHPNSELAKASGVRTGVKGGIWVDEYMRTSVEDVFAVGDCAEKKNFLTRDLSNVMLASTATAEARIAGSSLYNLRYVKGFTGTVATFSTVVGNLCFSSVGITESEAQKEKIDFVTGEFEIINRHPAVLPGATKQKIKLVAMKRTGAVIGGQVVGGVESGELVNLIGLMVENKMTIYSIINLQFATHPLLTASPLAYPVVKSAEMIAKKIDSCFI